MKRFKFFPVLGCSAIFLTFLFLNKETGDTWWSLRMGEEILQGKSPFIERWSWSSPGNYYPNHEIFFEVFAWLSWKLGNNSLFILYLIQAALITFIFWISRPSKILQKRLSLKSSALAASFIFILPAFYFAHYYFWEVRAQIFTFAFFALLLYLLRKEKFWPIPLLFIVWANTHAGFTAGALVLFAVWLTSCTNYLIKRDRINRHRVLAIGLIGVLSIGATFCTGMTWRLWPYVLSNASKVNSTIVEFQHIWKIDTAFNAFCYLVLLGTIVVFLNLRTFINHWETQVYLTAFLLFTPLSFWTLRFLPFMLFSLSFLLYIALMMPGSRSRKKIRNCGETIKIKISSKLEMILIFSLLFLVSLGSIFIGLHKVDIEKARTIPQSAQRSLATCPGHVYNNYSSGAYLLWAMKDHKVFIDNRYDPYYPKVLTMLDFSASSPWRDFLRKESISCVFTERHGTTDSTLQYEGWPVIWMNKEWILFTNPSYSDNILN